MLACLFEFADEAMSAESQQPSLPLRGSAIRSGVATGVSILTVSGAAAVAGAYLAHKFGRDARTDGFLAAYSVYLVIVLTAQAFRLVIVPDLTRAALDARLPAEFVSYASALLTVAVPATVLTLVLSQPFGDVLTGTLPPESASIAARALVWVVPAAFAQMLAALGASALAAADSYVVAAAAYALGGIAGLVVFVALADTHGLISLAWGLALNGAIAGGLPLAVLLRSGRLRGTRRGGVAIWPRLRKLAQSAAVPLALQGLYVIALRGASGLGEGNQTSLTYAYLFGATLVAATASSLSLISSAPLTRRGVDAEGAAVHVVHATLLSLALIGAAAGVFALVGGRVVEFVLGDAYTGRVGRDLGHLIVYLSPWVVAAVAFSVTFPLLFVLEKPRVLVPLAVLVLAVDIPLSLAMRALLGLRGLVLALALATLLVIVALMAAVSVRMLVLTIRGLARSALLVAALTVAAFGVPYLVVGATVAAPVGLVIYVGVLAALRPRGLVEAWRYVRVLHS
jgi:peptidoglycan biosynthesis protein MviN/MurJ (putative lipid II flippase)